MGENYRGTGTKVDEDRATEVEEFSMRKLGIFLLSRPRDIDFERVGQAYLLVGVKFEKSCFHETTGDWEFYTRSLVGNLIYVSQ